MNKDQRTLALIPARAGSKGLPGKNVRELCGKPLLAWPIEAAVACPQIDDVVVTTDSAEFAETAKQFGARAPFLRPAALASDTASSADAILHAIDWLEEHEQLEFDTIVLLEPTSPLTTSDDITNALAMLDAAGDSADAIVGISELSTSHPAYAVKMDTTGIIQPAFAIDFSLLPRRQDVESLYALDGSLYISRIDAFRRERGFYHERTIGFPTPRYQSLEIDDMVDFVCIEALMKSRDLLDQEGS